jgi:hypothetical protein
MQKYDSVTVKDIRVVNPDGLYYPAGYVAVTTPGSGKTTWKPAREAIGTPIMNCHGLVYSATFTPGDQIGKPNNLHRNLCINPLNANSNKGNLIDRDITPITQIHTREVIENRDGKFVVTMPGRYRIKAKWRGTIGNTMRDFTEATGFTPVNVKMLKNDKVVCTRVIPLECADT